MKKVDTSDPGKAALVAFSAAWLFSRTSEMNAENGERARHANAVAYRDADYAEAQQEALVLATTGEIPKWAVGVMQRRSNGEGGPT